MRFVTNYGFYELNPFPGCNQIVVANHSFIYPDFRGAGLGHKTHAARLKHIEDLGYDYVMCTVKKENVAQIKILEKAGWKHLDNFKNSETEKEILIYGKVIK